MKLSVIITSRHPESWLDKALTGFALQTWRDFEVIVVDEDPSRDTAELIAGRQHGYPVPLRHVWQPGSGQRQRGMVDQAIALAGYEYLLFTDGDCIPRRDFVAAHAALAERGRFLRGGCCRLGTGLSRQISRNDIVRGRCFELEWLQAHEPLSASSRRKLGPGPAAARLLDRVRPAVDFDGRNGSAWKQDLLAAGGGDPAVAAHPGAALGRRLDARGIRGKRIRYSAVCLQLEHGHVERGHPLAGEDAGAAALQAVHAGGERSPSVIPRAM